MKKIIDISLPLTNATPVYPNNVPLTIETHAEMPSANTHLSKVTLGTHTGTHVDAPSHAVIGANNLEQIPLETFIGQCKVFDVTHRQAGDAVKIEDLKNKVIEKGDRILFKTSNSIRGFESFYDDYVYVDGDLADWLAKKEIALVAIDALSIKQRGSKDQRPHTSLLSKNIPIIEGVNLKDVEEGEYELVCLPLKFEGVEASPVRAILVSRK